MQEGRKGGILFKRLKNVWSLKKIEEAGTITWVGSCGSGIPVAPGCEK
jgi:hypothetical protein